MWVITDRRWTRLLWVVVCGSFALSAFERACTAASAKPPGALVDMIGSSEPYCGAHCLYAAMRLERRAIAFPDLLKPKYIGSREGSSLKELETAARDFGMHALVVSNLTARALRQCPHPVILHVKSERAVRTYDHYVLFLGSQGGSARLLDPRNKPVALVPFKELMPRWDGTGMMVSAAPISLGSISAPDRQRVVIYVLITLAVVGMVHACRRLYPPLATARPEHRVVGASAAQAALLTVTALCFGAIYHSVDDEKGLLANRGGTASIQKAHIGDFIPKVSHRKLRRLLGAGTTVIDARFALDFAAGHIEGAINIPVDSNDLKRQQRVADIPKNTRIVVYCQSAGCRFAELVAIALLGDGFDDVAIFKGGWREWTTDRATSKPVASG